VLDLVKFYAVWMDGTVLKPLMRHLLVVQLFLAFTTDMPLLSWSDNWFVGRTTFNACPFSLYICIPTLQS